MTQTKVHIPTHCFNIPRINGLVDSLILDSGGVTITEGLGAWRHPRGHIVREPVTILEIYHNNDPLTALSYLVRGLHEVGETTVLVVTDGVSDFQVSPWATGPVSVSQGTPE